MIEEIQKFKARRERFMKAEKTELESNSGGESEGESEGDSPEDESVPT